MSERFGYVRRMSYPGERWHIVDVPPTADESADAPTLCGYRPWLGAWGTVASREDWMKVCARCDRARGRSEEGKEQGR